MNKETALRAIEKFMPSNISFFGGEPLLNWDVMKEVIEAHPSLKYGMTTNLTLLTDDMIDFIDKHNVGVLVSMDGLPHIHNRNRSNSYDIVHKNIQKLLSKCKRLVEVRVTVLPEDVPHLLSSIQHIYNIGVQNIIPVPVTDVPWTYDDYKELYRQVKMTYEWVLDVYADTSNRKNLTVRFVEEFLLHTLEGKTGGEPCGFGTEHFHAMGPDGRLWPCHQRPTKSGHPELCLGTVETYTGNIGRFDWKSTKCKNCTSTVCHGWCISEIMDSTGEVPRAACMWYRINEIIAKKYQKQILDSKNIRSQLLNRLKWNLSVKEKINEAILCNDELATAYKLVDIYADINGNKHLLFENFSKLFNSKLEELKNKCLISKKKQQ